MLSNIIKKIFMFLFLNDSLSFEQKVTYSANLIDFSTKKASSSILVDLARSSSV